VYLSLVVLDKYISMNLKTIPVSVVFTTPSGTTEFFQLGESLSSAPVDRWLVRELLASDAAYFRAAACCKPLPGCQLVRMSGLESLAAGCVLQKITYQTCGGSTPWLQATEANLLDLGCTHARFYQQYPDEKLEQSFTQHGYRPVVEIALLNTFDTSTEDKNVTGEVELHPVHSEKHWSLKLSLHRDTPEDPDGHSSPALDWLDMERRKCEAGYMEPFLIYFQGQPCGAVNLAISERLGRLKNLVIHPEWRRRGIGEEAARLITGLAQHRGKAAAGCFAINDEPSLALYQSAGYVPVTRQIEWYKKLS
jgi:ribosomal protein S18 acetylase RimI-like enzyme